MEKKGARPTINKKGVWIYGQNGTYRFRILTILKKNK